MVEVDSVRLSQTSYALGKYPNVPRSIATLRYLPAPDTLLMPQEGITLIINDGSELTPALCNELSLKNHDVVVLTFSTTNPTSTSSIQEGITEYVLADRQAETIRLGLSQLAKPVSQLIYLHPRLTSQVDVLNFANTQEKDCLKTAFLLAKYVKQSLTETAWQTRPAFLIVTRQDGAFGTANSGHDAILGGGLFGLTKSLNLEWPTVFCRAVDLSPELAAAEAAEKIRQELYDADQCLTQTAYNSAGKRFTLVAEPVAAISAPSLQARISKNSVFLVTGGGRGITASCVNQLAATFHCTFILLGRTELQAYEPDWAQGINDQAELKRQAMEALKESGEKPLPRTIERMVSAIMAQREIQTNLTYLKSLGSTVYYRAVDVTNPEAVKAVLSEVVPVTGPINGLIHGAGRLADKRIEHKTEYDFDAVFDVKVQGLATVMKAVSLADLQHVVLFSSVAGFYGNVGQTDYAMANEVLNRFAYLFQKNFPKAQVVSINWGAWDSGMVSPELKKMLLAHKVEFVPSDEGPRALVDQLSTWAKDQVQVLLGGTLPVPKAVTDGPLRSYTILRTMTLEANPFLAHHVIQGHPVLPINMANTWLAQTADTLYPGFQLFKETAVKLFKGLVFDGTQPTDFQITVQEQEKNAERIQVLATITSRQPGKLPLPHYQAQILLVSQPEKSAVESLPDIRNLHPVISDGSVLYQDGTLFHGADFQGVKQVITLNESGALLLCEHPGVSWERQGQFSVSSINGFLTDVMYQGLLIWVRRFHGCACLPLSTDWVEMPHKLPFGRPFYVSLSVVKSTEFTMSADLTAFDTITGMVYLKTHRANVSISRDLQWTPYEPLAS
ncbi:SDR family NAD(P)-dependent oxidoreductase [Spirosoma sp. BT702]|uniref:SDR family NAD(P)-dependent oxidoreductase n=1 Tax=Spirosoma profusum TaxID=2771354 RepID=A0A927AVA0_9BACT|nr:SDR family NAD(P)-dependent oxidoreductase [Spirosoma profusum]MBD2705062.1 SDR family NAD(P)-dependent oxidoreductase [Spirosoma profusum]